MIEEVLEEQKLSEAGVGGAGGLTRYKGRMSVFLKRLKEGTAFMTVDNVPFTFPPNENTNDIIRKLEQIIIDLDEGKPITSAKDPRYKELSKSIKLAGKPLNQILKDKELGGEVAGKRLKAEERQMNEIATAINNAVRQNGDSPIKLYIGKRGIVSINGVRNVTGTPKADCVLTLDDTPKCYVSLKSANKPNQMGQWGGITNYMSNPEIAKFIADLYLLQDKLENPRLSTAYYRVLESSPEQYVYGKEWNSGDPSVNNCDFVLASAATIALARDPKTDVYKFSSTNIFYNPQIPPSDWQPTLYGRYATGRNDAGLQNIRLSVSPLGYRKNVNDLPQFDASKESRALESQLDFKLEDIVAPTDIYDRERISYQDADAEEIERVQQRRGRPSLEEQIEIEIIDTEET